MRVYESLTFYRKCGCGNVYLIVNEDEGAFYNIIIKGDTAKELPCGESWFNSLSAILTYALRHSLWEGTSNKAIVKHLLNHRCNNPMRDWKTKEVVTSCSHIIGQMLLEYIKSRGLDEIEKEKEEAVTQQA